VWHELSYGIVPFLTILHSSTVSSNYYLELLPLHVLLSSRAVVIKPDITRLIGNKHCNSIRTMDVRMDELLPTNINMNVLDDEDNLGVVVLGSKEDPQSRSQRGAVYVFDLVGSNSLKFEEVKEDEESDNNTRPWIYPCWKKKKIKMWRRVETDNLIITSTSLLKKFSKPEKEISSSLVPLPPSSEPRLPLLLITTIQGLEYRFLKITAKDNPYLINTIVLYIIMILLIIMFL
jgi:hypothetical protein